MKDAADIKHLAESKRLKGLVDYAITVIEDEHPMVKTTPEESREFCKGFDMILGPYGIKILP